MPASAMLPTLHLSTSNVPMCHFPNVKSKKFRSLSRRNGIRRDQTNETKDIPEEKTKTLIAIALLYVASLCNSFALAFLNEVFPRERALPDLVFGMIPVQEWAWPISDVLVLTMGITMILSMMLHRYRWIVMRRVFLIAAVLYFCRAMAMLVTWMPLADRSMIGKCVEPSSAVGLTEFGRSAITNVATSDQQETSGMTSSEYRSSAAASTNGLMHRSFDLSTIPWSMIARRMWQYGFTMGFMAVESDRVLCGDYIYSGHTLTYVLTALVIRMYMPRRGVYGLLRTVYPLAAAVGMCLVVICRLHYTIDVLIAYWMTTLTYWCYHLLVAAPRPTNINNKSSGAIMRRDPKSYDCPTTFVTLDSEGQEEEEDLLEDPRSTSDRCEDPSTEESSLTSGALTSFNLFGSSVVLKYFERNVPPPSGSNGDWLPRELRWPWDGPSWIVRLVDGLNDVELVCDDD